jgi:hypothetical protein
VDYAGSRQATVAARGPGCRMKAAKFTVARYGPMLSPDIALMEPDPWPPTWPRIGFHERGVLELISNLESCATDAVPLPGGVAVRRSSPTWETSMRKQTSTRDLRLSAKRIGRAMQPLRRQADRVAAPVTARALREWALLVALDGHPTKQQEKKS